MNSITSAIIDTIRKNPNATTIKEFFNELETEFPDSKEEILNMTFGELCGFNPRASDRDIIDLLYQNREILKSFKTMNEICEIIGCTRDSVFKIVTYLKEDTTEKIKIEQDGKKKGAKYKVIEK